MDNLDRISEILAERDTYMARMGYKPPPEGWTRRRHATISGLTDGLPGSGYAESDTIDRACEDYVAGRIDVDELERRIEARLRELDS